MHSTTSMRSRAHVRLNVSTVWTREYTRPVNSHVDVVLLCVVEICNDTY